MTKLRAADVLGGIAFALGAWLIMTQILVPMVPALQHKPAGFGPVPDEPSSTDLDPAEQATSLGSG